MRITNHEEFTTPLEKYPSLGKRIQSIFIDSLFLILCMLLISELIGDSDQIPGWFRATLMIGLFGVYEPLGMTLGGTIGNRIMGIRVRRFNEEDHSIHLLQSYIRFILKCALGWASFLTIHSNTKKRAIHDIIAGTVVICKPGK
jgi:uncharacterized RDD family membrane protein YckC